MVFFGENEPEIAVVFWGHFSYNFCTLKRQAKVPASNRIYA